MRMGRGKGLISKQLFHLNYINFYMHLIFLIILFKKLSI